MLPFDASGGIGGVLVVLAGLRVAVLRAGVDGVGDLDAAVAGLAGARLGVVLALITRGLGGVLAGMAAAGVVSLLPWSEVDVTGPVAAI